MANVAELRKLLAEYEKAKEGRMVETSVKPARYISAYEVNGARIRLERSLVNALPGLLDALEEAEGAIEKSLSAWTLDQESVLADNLLIARQALAPLFEAE